MKPQSVLSLLGSPKDKGVDAGSGKALGQIVKENSKSAGAAYVDTVALQHFSGK